MMRQYRKADTGQVFTLTAQVTNGRVELDAQALELLLAMAGFVLIEDES